MKKPKLIWQEVFVVTGWQTEIVTGYGCFFPSIKEGICTYENCWLVFIENETAPTKLYKSEVFTDVATAMEKLKKEKKEYIKYCHEQVEKYGDIIKKTKF